VVGVKVVCALSGSVLFQGPANPSFRSNQDIEEDDVEDEHDEEDCDGNGSGDDERSEQQQHPSSSPRSKTSHRASLPLGSFQQQQRSGDVILAPRPLRVDVFGAAAVAAATVGGSDDNSGGGCRGLFVDSKPNIKIRPKSTTSSPSGKARWWGARFWALNFPRSKGGGFNSGENGQAFLSQVGMP
jgi:hypothetical protein